MEGERDDLRRKYDQMEEEKATTEKEMAKYRNDANDAKAKAKKDT